MMHDPIILSNISIQFLSKTCFSGFSTTIHHGSRIGIIGRNGSGKTSLLNTIQRLSEPSTGTVSVPGNVIFGYVPQLPNVEQLSGAQRFHKELTKALALHPNILCLDEPTNHLDRHNRESLMRLLKNFPRTIIIVSHDIELLQTCVDELWHIDEGSVHIFKGSYDDYISKMELSKVARNKKVEDLKKAQLKAREALQKEQKRAARSVRANKYENDKVLKSAMQERGSCTIGKKSGRINQLQKKINQALQETHIPEIIKPNFNLSVTDIARNKTIVTIADGSCGYTTPLLQDIHFQMQATEHVALIGDNGSGKSTLAKAILNDSHIQRTGTWIMPRPTDIGYLDQHYSTLNVQNTVFETIQNAVIGWTDHAIRRHLNDFLFRKNEEIQACVATLSGGEKARLSLALIAAKSPRLLILDEISNNLDLETRAHVIEVLKEYPGTMLVISHDQNFLEQIGVDTVYELKNGRIALADNDVQNF